MLIEYQPNRAYPPRHQEWRGAIGEVVGEILLNHYLVRWIPGLCSVVPGIERVHPGDAREIEYER